MEDRKGNTFLAKIEIIGVNPFIYLPENVLETIFKQAGNNKGKIPVKLNIDGHLFIQTLVKYSDAWRLYLNTPMRKAAGKEVGDTASFEVHYDASERVIQMHPKLADALNSNIEAKKVFDSLSASMKLEILRYIARLKTEASVEKNVLKAIQFLLGNERFIGRPPIEGK